VNAMAVFAGVATAEEGRRIGEGLLSKPVSEGDRMTPYYNFYVCDAMAAAGEYQQTLDFMRAYWGTMLARGATTWWEVFDPRDTAGADIPGFGPDWHGGMGYGTSLSHGWGSGPTDWLSHYVLGVWPSSPGFAEVEIVPHLCDLQWAEGAVPTRHGPIRVRHERTSEGLRSRVVLPSGVRARVGLPSNGGTKARIFVDGRLVEAESRDTGMVWLTLEGRGSYLLEAR